MYGLISILFANIPGKSGIIANHSNFSGAVAIVLDI